MAEKIRTMANHVCYRDFYDLYLLLQEADTNLEHAISLLHTKEIRALVALEAIAGNWQLVEMDAANVQRKIYFSCAISDAANDAMVQTFACAPILPHGSA